jgi:hypothetical protein
VSGWLQFRFGTDWVDRDREEAPRAASRARLSKIKYYLVDNLQVIRLSQVKERGQAESGWAAGRSSKVGI